MRSISGRLHGAVRLRWGFFDEMLPAPWAHRDEPTLHHLLKEAYTRGVSLDRGRRQRTKLDGSLVPGQASVSRHGCAGLALPGWSTSRVMRSRERTSSWRGSLIRGMSAVRRRRQRAGRRQAADPDLDRALEAMSAPELRSFFRTVFDGLNDDQRSAITESLVARATQGRAGWQPSHPPARVVDEARVFADAARRIAYADPDEVSDYLRRGTRAFLAGNDASARVVFEALLLLVPAATYSLGQHEMVEEVLNVDLHVTVAQYVASVYTTTPLGGRARAVLSAITDVEGVVSLANPLGEMEGVSAGALSDLGLFLPLWVKRLEQVQVVKGRLGDGARAMASRGGLSAWMALGVSSALRERRSGLWRVWPGSEALAEQDEWPAALQAHKTRRRGWFASRTGAAYPRRGRTRRSGLGRHDLRAAGGRVASRSHDDSVSALARRRELRARAYPDESR